MAALKGFGSSRARDNINGDLNDSLPPVTATLAKCAMDCLWRMALQCYGIIDYRAMCLKTWHTLWAFILSYYLPRYVLETSWRMPTSHRACRIPWSASSTCFGSTASLPPMTSALPGQKRRIRVLQTLPFGSSDAQTVLPRRCARIGRSPLVQPVVGQASYTKSPRCFIRAYY